MGSSQPAPCRAVPIYFCTPHSLCYPLQRFGKWWLANEGQFQEGRSTALLSPCDMNDSRHLSLGLPSRKASIDFSAKGACCLQFNPDYFCETFKACACRCAADNETATRNPLAGKQPGCRWPFPSQARPAECPHHWSLLASTTQGMALAKGSLCFAFPSCGRKGLAKKLARSFPTV